jgi:hypothetical protein
MKEVLEMADTLMLKPKGPFKFFSPSTWFSNDPIFQESPPDYFREKQIEQARALGKPIPEDPAIKRAWLRERWNELHGRGPKTSNGPEIEPQMEFQE